MSQAIAVVEALKRALKAKKQTYAHVARELDMSEASIKRMFAARHFTLERFEQICQFAGLTLTELARTNISALHFRRSKALNGD